MEHLEMNLYFFFVVPWQDCYLFMFSARQKLLVPLLLRRTRTNDDKLIWKKLFLALQDSSRGLMSQDVYRKFMIYSKKAGFWLFSEGKRAMRMLPVRSFNHYHHKGWSVPTKKTWWWKKVSKWDFLHFLLLIAWRASSFSCINVLPQEDVA